MLVGSPHRLLTLDDLKKVKEPLAALLLELPQREIGGQLPTWEELTAIVRGARTEHRAASGRSAAVGMPAILSTLVCRDRRAVRYGLCLVLQDSGGITGAMLLGPDDIVAEARIWQRRHGGNLVRMFPFVLSAKQGLETRLDRMGLYHAKAIEIAEALSAFPEIEVMPNPPHTNMLHVFVRGEADRLEQAALEIAQEQKPWLVNGWQTSQIPAYRSLN